MRHYLLLGWWLALCHVAYADTSVLLFGASKHNGCDQNRYPCKFEQFNPGAGLEWSPTEEPWGRPFVRGGLYRDSEGKTAYFATGGLRKDFLIGDDFTLGAGLMAGYLNGSNHNGVVAVPFVSAGSGRVAVEMGYADNRLGHHVHQERVSTVITFSARVALY
ncbi:hypothetical protein OL229_11885 [Neisseriaceae bacterium JH1-16]|nr:hypothetical protein [Neisseriaceae bacterium JH1-16]